MQPTSVLWQGCSISPLSECLCLSFCNLACTAWVLLLYLAAAVPAGSMCCSGLPVGGVCAVPMGGGLKVTPGEHRVVPVWCGGPRNTQW